MSNATLDQTNLNKSYSCFGWRMHFGMILANVSAQLDVDCSLLPWSIVLFPCLAQKQNWVGGFAET